MNPLRLFLVSAFLGSLACSHAVAQTVVTSSKQRINLADTEVRGDRLIQKKKLPEGGFVEIGVPLSTIASVEWPLPPELSAAEAEVEQGSPLAAVPALRRQAALHAPFRHAEGSHWLRAQVAFVRALAGAGLPDEAERELKQLKTGKPPADILPGLELDILLARASAGDWNTFAPRFAALREAGLSEGASARLWLAQAEHDRRRGQPEKALFAFLQVTVFHPRSETAQPAALLGAIRCYRALGETEQARLATEEILRRFADTPEASAASKEIPSV